MGSSTFFNDALKLNMSTLTNMDNFSIGKLTKSTLAWEINGEEIAKIDIYLQINNEDSFVVLKYSFKKENKLVKIQIISNPSNLGIGMIWLFICPITLKKCRTLYVYEGIFGHRNAFKGCLYESQSYSKKMRVLFQQYSIPYNREDAYEKIYSKHFKKFYKGNCTKKHLRLLKIIDKRIDLSIFH